MALSAITTEGLRGHQGGAWTSGWRFPILAAVIVLLGAMVRLALGPQFDGLDDAGYLDAAVRVARGQVQPHHSLFYLRLGMSYPFAWLMRLGLGPTDFGILTTAVESLTTLGVLVLAGRLWGRHAGLCAALLYASYPLAVSQATVFMPTVFQIAAITGGLYLLEVSREPGHTWASAYAVMSGLVVGVGYLVKEDVALFVPAVVIAAVLTRHLSVRQLCWLCVGFGTVVAVESLFHYIQDGSFFYRFAVTGEPGVFVDGLKMNALWSWDGFLRPLLLMPYQVGLYWWACLGAVGWALWRGDRAERYIALVLCVLFLYLQFGSASFTTYVPLPKSSRYSAIMTPMMILLVTGWLRFLQARGRRRLVLGLAIALVAASVPSLLAVNLTASERTRNVVELTRYLRSQGAERVYVDAIDGRLLRILAGSNVEVRDWFRADFARREMKVLVTPEELSGYLAFVDYQGAKVYTSTYSMRLPGDVEKVAQESTVVLRTRAYPEDGWQRAVLQWAKRSGKYLPEYVGRRVSENCDDMLDNDGALLLRVGPNVSTRGTARIGR